MRFADHFSAVARDYAGARPTYPPALFDWIASVAPGRALAWEAGCGSGQATAGLAGRFGAVHATDPSQAQVAEAPVLPGVAFRVEPAEHCSLPAACADVACVAQALHWFDRPAFFAECARVLRPGGVLVAWGYQDIVLPAPVRGPGAAFAATIAAHWPPERALVDAGYAGFDWPFESLFVPPFELAAEWTLPRLLAYFSSYSATKRHREETGSDPVALHAPALAQGWGDPAALRRVAWPLFVHARRKPG